MTLARARGAGLSAGRRWSSRWVCSLPPRPTRLPRRDRDGDLTQPDRDWPMFGGSAHRNLANTVEKNIPTSWSVARAPRGEHQGEGRVGRQRLWRPRGRRRPRVRRDQQRQAARPRRHRRQERDDVLRESDGAFLWQIVHDKLDDSNIDPPGIGIASTPAVEGDRLYYVSNRGELVCATSPAIPTPGARATRLVAGHAEGPGSLPGRPGRRHGRQLAPGPGRPCVRRHLQRRGREHGQTALAGMHQFAGGAQGQRQGRVGEQPARRLPQTCNSAARPRPRSTASGRSSSPAATAGCTASRRRRASCSGALTATPRSPYSSRPPARGMRNYLLATPVVADGKAYIGVGREPDAGLGVGHVVHRLPEETGKRGQGPVAG